MSKERLKQINDECLVDSNYDPADPAVAVNDYIRRYDPESVTIGEFPSMEELLWDKVTDEDDFIVINRA